MTTFTMAVPGTGTQLLCLFYSGLTSVSPIMYHSQLEHTLDSKNYSFLFRYPLSINYRTELYSFDTVTLKPTKKLQELE